MSRPTFAQTLGAYSRNPLAFFRLVRRLPAFVRLFWRLFWDRRTGWAARAVLLGTLLYVASPVDLLPAAIFNVVGLMDDLTVLIFGCQAFIRLVPPSVVDDHVAAVAPDGAAPSS